eukprot:GILJ01041627.1.p3 GENE.GILJ01041627.1~~GILJ01041627.1.p3  ORF type:complete len:103 (+),score=6.79 GILJ01041627.1:400-708(+)
MTVRALRMACALVLTFANAPAGTQAPAVIHSIASVPTSVQVTATVPRTKRVPAMLDTAQRIVLNRPVRMSMTVMPALVEVSVLAPTPARVCLAGLVLPVTPS